jgi:hypothetical protein
VAEQGWWPGARASGRARTAAGQPSGQVMMAAGVQANGGGGGVLQAVMGRRAQDLFLEAESTVR